MNTDQRHVVPPCTDDMPRRCRVLRDQFLALWWESETTLPELGRIYSIREKLEREALFRKYLSTLEVESRNMALGEVERQASKARVRLATIDFAKNAIGFEEQLLEDIFAYGFLEVAAQFSRACRSYDPNLSDADIFQASRNVWSMNFIQLLLGRPVNMTPSVFAYSLLYPYSDNYIDDPAVPLKTKKSFNERFRQRLEGQAIRPANPQEAMISGLIGQIEGEFDRRFFPQVYDCLLAIHRAQSRSLQLLQRNASPYEIDVLGICLEKGGISVLADGYLVAGQLNTNQQDMVYSYGAFTQLIDDLEDVQADLEKGLNTVYSQTARHWSLDAVTNRTFHFWDKVKAVLAGGNTPSLHPLMEVVDRYVPLMLIAEVGFARRYYSRAYIRELEAHCPVRFSFLISEQKRLQHRGILPLHLVEALAG